MEKILITDNEMRAKLMKDNNWIGYTSKWIADKNYITEGFTKEQLNERRKKENEERTHLKKFKLFDQLYSSHYFIDWLINIYARPCSDRSFKDSVEDITKYTAEKMGFDLEWHERQGLTPYHLKVDEENDVAAFMISKDIERDFGHRNNKTLYHAEGLYGLRKRGVNVIGKLLDINLKKHDLKIFTHPKHDSDDGIMIKSINNGILKYVSKKINHSSKNDIEIHYHYNKTPYEGTYNLKSLSFKTEVIYPNVGRFYTW